MLGYVGHAKVWFRWIIWWELEGGGSAWSVAQASLTCGKAINFYMWTLGYPMDILDPKTDAARCVSSGWSGKVLTGIRQAAKLHSINYNNYWHWDSLKPSHLSTLAARPFEKKMRILVLTFKNHALDEFLLDCRKHCPDADIVRIGGQGFGATWACPKSAGLQ